MTGGPERCSPKRGPGNESLPPSLVKAYEQALFEVHLPRGTVILSVAGLEQGDPEALPEAPLSIVTAYNPGLLRPGHLQNERANRLLEQHLKAGARPYYPALGYNADRSHTEPSFAVVGLTREESVLLGRHYRQASVFYWNGVHGKLLWCRVGL